MAVEKMASDQYRPEKHINQSWNQRGFSVPTCCKRQHLVQRQHLVHYQYGAVRNTPTTTTNHHLQKKKKLRLESSILRGQPCPEVVPAQVCGTTNTVHSVTPSPTAICFCFFKVGPNWTCEVKNMNSRSADTTLTFLTVPPVKVQTHAQTR